jgi:hypothetical protein
MVGAVRFELTTSWTRTKRATSLRYAPTRATRLPRTQRESNVDFSRTKHELTRLQISLRQNCHVQMFLEPRVHNGLTEDWWACSDSNREPKHYECSALTIELQAR